MSSDEAAEEPVTDAVESPRIPVPEEEESEPVDVDHRPPRLAQGVAAAAFLLGTLMTIPFATLSIPFGFTGLLVFMGGLFYSYSRGWLTAGTGLVLMGAILTGAFGAIPAEMMLLGIGSVILGWDVGQHGVVIGQQLGRKTLSQRNLLIHTAMTGIVIGFISMVAFGVFFLAGDGREAAAVGLIVFGIVLATWVFRR